MKTALRSCLPIVLLALACGDDNAAPNSAAGSGGSGASAGTAGFAGSFAGTAGFSGTTNNGTGGTLAQGGAAGAWMFPGGSGGSAAIGGSAGSSGTGGSGGTAGAGAGGSGLGGGGSAGAAGVGGSGGTAGTGALGGSAGTAGSGGSGGSAGTAGNAGTGGSGGSGGSPTAPSCVGLPATCGSMGDEDCCTSLPVTGGIFLRGYNGVDLNNVSYPATISDFSLDKYEITVGRFRKFVEAGGGTQLMPPTAGSGANPNLPGSGWDNGWDSSLPANSADLIGSLHCTATADTWTDMAGANEEMPVNCISWYLAFSFCAWDGGRLPTEAEWNIAAVGGSEYRYYPWSSPANSTTIDGTFASYDCAADGSMVGQCAFSDILQVGSRPQGSGPFGHQDLAGNLGEWVLDRVLPPVNSNTYPNPMGGCIDCAELPKTTGFFVAALRGGNHTDSASALVGALRSSDGATVQWSTNGARCAR